MIRNYIKIAIRNFSRHRLFTLINVSGLSIGISAALVIFLVVRYDSSFDKFYPGSNGIYRVVNDYNSPNGKFYLGGVAGAIPEAARTQLTGISHSAPFFMIDEFTLYRAGVIIPNGSGAALKFKYSSDMVLADQRYFDMFPYKWLAGSKSELNKPFTVVLTEQKARKYFPGLTLRQMLGRVLIYGNTIKTTVAGIVQAHTQNTDFNFNDFISYSTGAAVTALKNNLDVTNWSGVTPSSQFFVKLKPSASVSAVERQLNQIFINNTPADVHGKPGARAMHLEKLSDIHFDEQYASYNTRTASKTTLNGLVAVAAFLLLLACINFINLTTAQSVQRAKEIGIRKTMGSSRRQLVTQFLSETFVVTLVAVALSVAITPLILKLFAAFIPAGLTVGVLYQAGTMLFLSALTIIVSLAAGFYPALVLSGFKPAMAFKNQAGHGSGETRNAWLRKSLTVSQFVIAQFFIIATALVGKQLYYVLHKDLGFKKDAIVVVETPWNAQEHLRQVFMNDLKALPQVNAVSIGGASPSSDNTHSTRATYTDGKKTIVGNVQERFGDENYINVYGIKLLAGRNIGPGDVKKAFLVNQAYTKTLGFQNPADAVGITVDYSGMKMQVAGVIGDFYYKSLHTGVEPLVIVTRSDNSYFSSTFHIALKPETADGREWSQAVAAMQADWQKLYPDSEFAYSFFDDSIAKFYESEKQTSALLNWATFLSVLISCMGLLGLTIYTINQRTREIGIRKVLGATVTQITALLSKELVGLIALAFIIAGPAAWWAMHQWIQSFAERTAISWWIFALSGAGMLVLALFASGFQTIKAALMNPVKSLKSE